MGEDDDEAEEEGEKVGDLLDMVSMVRSIFQLQGRSMDRRDILRNLLNLFPSNRIVSVALISTYPGLAPIIETGERERIMMENPDLMVFWPYLMNYGFSEDFREEWGARWGMGQNIWPGSGAPKLSEKLAALEEEEGEDGEDGGLWNFGKKMLGL
ncbi:hypothetical protein LCGC14_2938090 [marine sediment metagenome]|uniref:Uncharacterized protein n=1 Tax=marine sediment metagenome TaxID=412755 RepID=A0A0F8XIV6_9ZZZZ